ncbi:MAG: hypothetical protein GF332_04205 [Candidatus Moranbacteria bacterium]|nr:hypothetical protein [Candidatus Moranbacteria bacterium]
MKASRKAKIFIISESKSDGSYYYRGEIFAKNSKFFEVKTNVNFKDQKFIDNKKYFDHMFESEVVIFLRPLNITNLYLLEILKKAGKLIITDNDDDFSLIPKFNNSYFIRRRYAKVNEKFTKNSHAVFCTNDYLKNRIQKNNENTYVIKNYIDKKLVKDLNFNHCPETDKKKPTILISGSVLNKENMLNFIPILKQIHKQVKNLKIVFWGLEKNIQETVKQEFKIRTKFISSVDYINYHQTLSKIQTNVALIPRKENQFNKSKSNCKYLELSLANIPVIAQGYADGASPYQRDIIDGENGFIAITPNQWKNKIRGVLENPELGRLVAKKANRYVKKNYDIVKNIHEWEQAIQSLLKEFQLKNKLPNEHLKNLQNYLIHSFQDLADYSRYLESNIKIRDRQIIKLNNKLNKLPHKIVDQVLKAKKII